MTRGPASVHPSPHCHARPCRAPCPGRTAQCAPGGTTVPITGTAHLCVYYDSFGRRGEDTCLFLIDTKALCALAVP